MATPEKSSASEQSLTHKAAQRVILLLKGLDIELEGSTKEVPITETQSLSEEGAAHLITSLHKSKSKSERALSKIYTSAGRYVLEFLVPEKSRDEAVAEVVTSTDAALLSAMVPAELAEAWIVPPGRPALEHLTEDDYERMPVVTPIAKEILEQHRHQTLDQDFNRLLFVA